MKQTGGRLRGLIRDLVEGVLKLVADPLGDSGEPCSLGDPDHHQLGESSSRTSAVTNPPTNVTELGQCTAAAAVGNSTSGLGKASSSSGQNSWQTPKQDLWQNSQRQKLQELDPGEAAPELVQGSGLSSTRSNCGGGDVDCAPSSALDGCASPNARGGTFSILDGGTSSTLHGGTTLVHWPVKYTAGPLGERVRVGTANGAGGSEGQSRQPRSPQQETEVEEEEEEVKQTLSDKVRLDCCSFEASGGRGRMSRQVGSCPYAQWVPVFVRDQGRGGGTGRSGMTLV
eukprot:jgi/Botrbrau1/17654/Bobra.0166s0082.1